VCEGVRMTEQEILTAYEDNFKAVDASIAGFDNALDKYAFKSTLKHSLVLGLAQRLLEFSRGSEAMGRAGLAAANAAMGRMCLETLFKLKALCLDAVSPEDYVKQERVAQYQSIRRALELPSVSPVFTDEEQAKYRTELQETELELGIPVKKHEIKLSEWAKRAGEERTYALSYSALSDYVHTGVSSLVHMMEVREQGQVFIQTGPSTHQLASLLEGVCIYLALATEAIDHMFANELLNE